MVEVPSLECPFSEPDSGWVLMLCCNCGQKAWVELKELSKSYDAILCANCLIKIQKLDNLEW